MREVYLAGTFRMRENYLYCEMYTADMPMPSHSFLRPHSTAFPSAERFVANSFAFSSLSMSLIRSHSSMRYPTHFFVDVFWLLVLFSQPQTML